MARHTTVLAPTPASLPDGFRVASTTPSLIKTLSRLSRPSLIDLAFQWLDDANLQTCCPYLATSASKRGAPLGGGGVGDGDDDDGTNPYAAENTVEDVRRAYRDLQDRRGGKREVIDRILEGDWRHGISLKQLAMAHLRYIEDNPSGSGYRWTAFQLVPAVRETTGDGEGEDEEDAKAISSSIPRLSAATFIKYIQREISSLVKAHYHILHSKSLPLTFVRIFVIDSPYQYPRQSHHAYTDSSKIICLAFPDSTPYIYSSLFSLPGAAQGTSNLTTTDTRTLRRVVMDAIPKALSRPQARFKLKQTSLSAKSLHTLLSLRGPWRTNAANGAFTIFADAVADGNPLDPRLPESVPPRIQGRRTAGPDHDAAEGESQKENNAAKARMLSSSKRDFSSGGGLSSRESTAAAKKRKLTVISRFGTLGHPLTTVTATSSTTSDATLPDLSKSIPPSSTGLDRLQIHLKDPPILPPEGISADAQRGGGDNDDNAPHSASNTTVSLLFSGTDVICGLRKLAELGLIDAERMPSWMTGEEGVSSAAVRGGKRVKGRNPDSEIASR